MLTKGEISFIVNNVEDKEDFIAFLDYEIDRSDRMLKYIAILCLFVLPPLILLSIY